MWKLVDIKPSTRSGKKWVAHFHDPESGRDRHTHFGATGYEDYTQHKDLERAKAYRRRHMKDLATHDPTRAGFLSFFVLWAGPDFHANINSYKKRFHL